MATTSQPVNLLLGPELMIATEITMMSACELHRASSNGSSMRRRSHPLCSWTLSLADVNKSKQPMLLAPQH